MMYLIGLLICGLMGYLTLRLMAPGITGVLRVFLGMAFGLDLNGFIVFFTHLWFGVHQSWAAPAVSLLVLGGLIYFNRRGNWGHTPISPLKFLRNRCVSPISWPSLILLLGIALFTLAEAMYYPLGGWDAWSSWNLKAKFIYLGKEQWKAMLDPLLWRSNTHYPLLVPCINVWFWDLCSKAHEWVPMLNSVLFTTTSAGILLFGLRELTNKTLLPCLLTAAVFLLPFNITLAASQYSDGVFGMYVLAAFVCLLLEKNRALSPIFIGFLSFTKVEGTMAAIILGGLLIWRYGKSVLPALLIATLPTVLFNFFISPKNEAFVNGLLSIAKPSTWERLQVIAQFTALEFVSLKWNGLWLLILAGLLLSWKKSWRPNVQPIAIFLGLYLAVALGYYYVNTFFEIGWWLQNTLNRILFALLPTFMLWLGLALAL